MGIDRADARDADDQSSPARRGRFDLGTTLMADTATSPADPPRSWRRLSLSARIVIGLALGVLTGLFFGEPAAALQPLADIYIRLMQMMVLPYLMLALVVGIGQLDAATARRMGLTAGALLAVFWAATLALVGALPLAFPPYESASFFSTTLIEAPVRVPFAELYVPSNPFNALANSVIPAVVLFSMAIGIALIGVPGKEALMANLRVIDAAVTRVARFVIGLTPVGVFAIGAVAAGTLDPTTLERLAVYMVTFGVAALLLTFVIIPLLVVAVTPFRYREVVAVAKDALLTAFVANSVFIVLPLITERAKELIRRHGKETATADSVAEVVVPIAFVFPNAGRLLTLLFVPFAAWLAGSALPPEAYATLFSAGLFAYFAKAQVALPFLMDLLGVPHDYFQLYIPTTIINGKFDSMVSAMNLLALALMGAAAMGGFMTFSAGRLLRCAGGIAAAIAAAVLASRLGLAWIVDTSYHKDEVLKAMHLPREAVTTVVKEELAAPERPDPDLPALDRIRTRGVLRIGFARDNLPYAFENARGRLVGFDVEIGSLLARDLGLTVVEFYPVERNRWVEMLRFGRIDAVISAVPGTVRPGDVLFSTPLLESVMALAVEDGRREDFDTVDSMRRLGRIRLGIPPLPYQAQRQIAETFAGVDLEFVTVESPRDFFEGRRPEVDALIARAEVASAWTLLEPRYSVVVPRPRVVKIPVAIALRPGDRDLRDAVDEWLVAQKSHGTIERAYDYWILGRGAEPRRPRWSIKRDVLGWGK